MTQPFTHDPEPTRLLESLAGDVESDLDHLGLRQDLEAARAARVDYSVDAGLARFEATLAGASTLPSGGTVAGFAVLRWFLGATALLGVGVVAWLLNSEPEAPGAYRAELALVDEPAPPQFRSEDGKVAEIVSTTPTGVGDASSVAATDLGGRKSVAEPQQHGGNGKIGASLSSEGVEPAGQLAVAPRPTSKSLSTPVESGEPAVEEAKLIDAARKALTDDPARTLELTEQATKRFPTGAMIQERRGYAILALLALDRRTEAEDQASEYLERWPKGPLSRRIREGLGLLP